MEIPSHIFREYDIRGLMDKEIDFSFVHKLGFALAKYFHKHGQCKVLLGYDSRRNSLEYHNILAKQFAKQGFEIISLGAIPSPCLYFAAYKLNIQAGIMVTASHNDAPYNGFKLWLKQRNLYGFEIQDIYQIMLKAPHTWDNDLKFSDHKNYNIMEEYCNAICKEIGQLNYKVVLDGSNAVAGKPMSNLLSRLGAEVVELYCEPSSDFPNHAPNPTLKENCKDLCNKVLELGADCGIALDGDGDRVVLVDKNGRKLESDELLLILAKDLLLRKAGAKILADVKCSQKFFTEVEKLGGLAIMSASGHSLMKKAMGEENALLGGEFSGHFFHAENWFGTDDGLLTAVRALKILQDRQWDLINFPTWEKSHAGSEIYFYCAENKKKLLMQKAKEFYAKKYKDAKLSFVDGLRVDFENAWFLIRVSNTAAALTLRFEAQTKKQLEELQKEKIKQLTLWNNELNRTSK